MGFDQLAALVRDLGYHLNAVKLWDSSDIYAKAALVASSDHLCGRHTVPPGMISVICFYMQYFWLPQVEQDPCLCPGYLPHFPADADTYWRLTIGGKPTPDCERITNVRNPWGPWGASYPCWYPSPINASGYDIDFVFHLGPAHHYAAAYEVGGRIMGFDVPADQWAKEASAGREPSRGIF